MKNCLGFSAEKAVVFSISSNKLLGMFSKHITLNEINFLFNFPWPGFSSHRMSAS